MNNIKTHTTLIILFLLILSFSLWKSETFDPAQLVKLQDSLQTAQQTVARLQKQVLLINENSLKNYDEPANLIRQMLQTTNEIDHFTRNTFSDNATTISTQPIRDELIQFENQLYKVIGKKAVINNSTAYYISLVSNLKLTDEDNAIVAQLSTQLISGNKVDDDLLGALVSSKNDKLEKLYQHASLIATNNKQLVQSIEQLFKSPLEQQLIAYETATASYLAELKTKEKVYRFIMYATALGLIVYLILIIRLLNQSSSKLQNSLISLSHEKERALITLLSLNDAVITLNKAGKIEYMNPAAEAMTGHISSKAAGFHFIDTIKIIDEETGDVYQDFIFRALNSGEVVNKQNLIVESTFHNQLIVNLSCSPIKDDRHTIIGCVIVLHDITETRKITKELSWQAYHDALTGLPNRLLLGKRLADAMRQADETGQLLALLFIDLDGFKAVNDRFGHEQGDHLLKTMANRLKNAVGLNDTVARLGGDEFIVLLTNLPTESAVLNELKILMNIVTHTISFNGVQVNLYASMGVTTYPQAEVDADTLVRQADIAMYQAKLRGKHQYIFFDVELAERSRYEEKMRLDIKEAINDNQFVLYYQPKANMRTGEVYGVEALIRWDHPQEGIKTPHSFLNYAENTDLIIHIGDWVLNDVMQQITTWKQRGIDIQVAVNISPYQLKEENFLAKVKQLLAHYPQVSANNLQFELIESAAIDDIETVSDIIEQCHQMGISFALDDFGVGYASLSYIKQLPTDVLKIDRSFITDMLTDHNDLSLVQGILSLAKIFDRKVVAEGVESLEHGVMLMRLGCELAQGFGIGMPMSVTDLERWLECWQPDQNWALWSDINWHPEDFPLLISPNDHWAGMARVMMAVEEPDNGIPRIQMKDHLHCRLGQWYYGRGLEKYGDVKEFQELEYYHRITHDTAAQILGFLENDDFDSAKTLLPQLEQQRDDVIERLFELHQIVFHTTPKKVEEAKQALRNIDIFNYTMAQNFRHSNPCGGCS